MNTTEGRVVIASMIWLGLIVLFYKDVLGWAKYWEQSFTTTGAGKPHGSITAPGAIKWVAGYAGLAVVLVLMAEAGAEELAAAFAVLIATSATFVLGPDAIQNFQKIGS